MKYFTHFIIAKTLQMLPEIKFGLVPLYFEVILAKSYFKKVIMPAIKAAKGKMYIKTKICNRIYVIDNEYKSRQCRKRDSEKK